MSINTIVPSVSGEIRKTPHNDAFQQFIDNDIDLQSQISSNDADISNRYTKAETDALDSALQSQITANKTEYDNHVLGTDDKHNSDAIVNVSSVVGATVSGALNTVQQQVNALVVGGTTNTTIGVYSLTLGGVANAYTATFATLTYFGGLKINATINVANTGASTINLNSLGVKNIKKMSASGSKLDLVGGDLKLNNKVQLEYDGTDFILLQESKSETFYTLAMTPTTSIQSVTDSYDGIIDAEIGGATLYQAVVNGDFANGATGWNGVNVTLGVVSGELECTVAALASTNRIQSATLFPKNTTDKWFIKGLIRPKHSGRQTYLQFGGSKTSDFLPTTNMLNEIYGIITPLNTTDPLRFYHNTASTYVIGDKYQHDNIIAIPITGTPYENYTADQMNAMVNEYFEGLKYTDELSILSRGRNLFDGNTAKFLSAAFVEVSGYFDVDKEVISWSGSSSTAGAGVLNTPVEIKTYTFSNLNFVGNGNIYVRFKDKYKNVTLPASITGWTNIGSGIYQRAFNSGSNISLSIPSGTAYLDYTITSAPSTSRTLTNFMLNESSTALPYEPNKNSILSVECTDDTKFALSKVGTLQDEINQVSGYISAVKRNERYALASADITAYAIGNSNVDVVVFNKKLDDINYGNLTIRVGSVDGGLYKSMGASDSLNDVNSINKIFMNQSTTSYNLVVAKGAYADVNAARTDLVTNKQTKILYNRATPVFIPYENFDQYGINVEGALASHSGYTNVSYEGDIVPNVNVTYAMDLGAGISSVKDSTATALSLATETYNIIDQDWQSWTPTLTWTGTPPLTPTTVAKYKQIGSTVHFNLSITSTDGNGASQLTITLPIAPKVNSTTVSLNAQEKVNTTWTNPLAYILDSGSLIQFRSFSTATDNVALEVLVSGSYEVV